MAVVPVIEEWSWKQPAAVYAVLALLAGGAALAALAAGRSKVAQTTLVPAWWWSVAAAVAWTATELAAGIWQQSQAVWLGPARLAAMTLSFCPVLAVLGAKRPQHAAWSFVVAAFWGIVTLPAVETFFLQRGQRLEIGDARSWFLWILIAIGPINYLPTSRWLASVMIAAGQILALSEFLPLIQRPIVPHQHLLGLWLAASGLVIARMRSSPPAHQPYDRLWLDFRDLFGLFWSLRLQERVSTVAQSQSWPLQLGWSGFRNSASGDKLDGLDPGIEKTLRTTMRGLLRRFVSGRWIAERIARDID